MKLTVHNAILLAHDQNRNHCRRGQAVHHSSVCEVHAWKK